MLRHRAIRIAPIFIVLFWLVMMGLLVQREVITPNSAALESGSSQPLVPTDTWMGIYLPGDVRAGFLNLRTIPGIRNGEEGARVQLTMQMALTLFGHQTEMSLLGSAWSSFERGLVDGDFRLRSEDTETRVVASRKDDFMDIQVHTGGEVFPVQFPMRGQPAMLGGGGVASIAIPRLEVGDQYMVNTFDPLSLSVQEARIRCVAEETIQVDGASVDVSITEVTINRMKSTAWVADGGELIRLETPFGLTLRRISSQEALSKVDLSEATMFLGATAIEPMGEQPFSGARRMLARLSGVPHLERIPEDDTQHWLDEDTLQIVMPPEAFEPGASNLLSEVDDPSLGSDPFIQAEHPVIRNKASEIIGDRTEPWDQAMALYDWIVEHIESEPVMSIPSALEVLQIRRGDCNEQSVLYTALARSIGLPTRVAIGVVWSAEYEGFYYHAWPEVYITENEGPGRWVWIDPTLSQPIADATHIKLFTGSIDRWTELLQFIGQLDIEVIEIE